MAMAALLEDPLPNCTHSNIFMACLDGKKVQSQSVFSSEAYCQPHSGLGKGIKAIASTYQSNVVEIVSLEQ